MSKVFFLFTEKKKFQSSTYEVVPYLALQREKENEKQVAASSSTSIIGSFAVKFIWPGRVFHEGDHGRKLML